LAGALLFDEKIHQSAALFWCGLRPCGMLEFFKYVLTSRNPKTNVDFPAFFGDRFGGKDCGL
jgi:hypothetical protein